MLTLTKFSKKSHLAPELIRAVVKQCGGWDEFKSIAHDVYNHGASGGFSGFIYYTDTVGFTSKYKKPIWNLCKEYSQDCDLSGFEFISKFRCLNLDIYAVAEAWFDKKSEDRTDVFNALAWFALESVAYSFVDELDS